MSGLCPMLGLALARQVRDCNHIIVPLTESPACRPPSDTHRRHARLSRRVAIPTTSHRLASASIVHYRMGISTSFSASPATISRIWSVMTDGVTGMLSLLIPASFSHPRLGQSLGVQKLWQRRQSSLHVSRRSDDPSGRCYPSREPSDHLRSLVHHVVLDLVGDGERTVVGLLTFSHGHNEKQPS
jgi:hypothetical protein